MKIAVLSDSHDNIWRLEEAMPHLREADAVIHCGDLCSPFVVRQLGEGLQDIPIHIVWGNNDGDTFLLSKVASAYSNITLHGLYALLEIDELRIAVNHYPVIARGLALTGLYDLVCYGHDHTGREEMIATCLLLNPGELMGMNGHSTFAVVDTRTRTVTWVELREDREAPPVTPMEEPVDEPVEELEEELEEEPVGVSQDEFVDVVEGEPQIEAGLEPEEVPEGEIREEPRVEPEGELVDEPEASLQEEPEEEPEKEPEADLDEEPEREAQADPDQEPQEEPEEEPQEEPEVEPEGEIQVEAEAEPEPETEPEEKSEEPDVPPLSQAETKKLDEDKLPKG
jgi:putative phosphoesterase